MTRTTESVLLIRMKHQQGAQKKKSRVGTKRKKSSVRFYSQERKKKGEEPNQPLNATQQKHSKKCIKTNPIRNWSKGDENPFRSEKRDQRSIHRPLLQSFYPCLCTHTQRPLPIRTRGLIRTCHTPTMALAMRMSRITKGSTKAVTVSSSFSSKQAKT